MPTRKVTANVLQQHHIMVNRICHISHSKYIINSKVKGSQSSTQLHGRSFDIESGISTFEETPIISEGDDINNGIYIFIYCIFSVNRNFKNPFLTEAYTIYVFCISCSASDKRNSTAGKINGRDIFGLYPQHCGESPLCDSPNKCC